MLGNARIRVVISVSGDITQKVNNGELFNQLPPLDRYQV